MKAKSLAIAVLLVFVTCGWAGSARTPADHTNLVALVKWGRNPDVPGAKNITGPCVFKLGGKHVTTIEGLKEAIVALPRGTEVRWNSGCIWYETIPIRGPKTSIADFTAYCGTNGVTFTYVVSGF